MLGVVYMENDSPPMGPPSLFNFNVAFAREPKYPCKPRGTFLTELRLHHVNTWHPSYLGEAGYLSSCKQRLLAKSCSGFFFEICDQSDDVISVYIIACIDTPLADHKWQIFLFNAPTHETIHLLALVFTHRHLQSFKRTWIA